MKRCSRMLIAILILGMLTPCAQAASYTTFLTAAIDIYSGPGYGYAYVRDVGEDGTYTIVEEAMCEDELIWGRLKSGLGWVMLKSVYLDESYTMSLDGSTEIYDGPGDDYSYKGVIGSDGVFTIVAEMRDDQGNCWGKLKSGAGWVKLTGAAANAPYVDTTYTASLGAWVPIYSAPDETSRCNGVVGEDGVYTIVEEALDSLGNVWGRLKSGAGWVNLNYVRTMGHPPITAYFADVVDLSGGNSIECIVDRSEGMSRIAFRANERLEDVALSTVWYTGDTYAVGENHCSIRCLEEDMYFVAGVVFYGDMTTYGISFTDEGGERRHYAVSLSGMDGSLVMNEYVP